MLNASGKILIENVQFINNSSENDNGGAIYQ